MLMAACLVAALTAEGNAGSVKASGTAISKPGIPRDRIKPLKWLRRIASADVTFPLWLSSRGIPAPNVEPENRECKRKGDTEDCAD